jgi:branched-chain amino acid transport system ATP-binding protein
MLNVVGLTVKYGPFLALDAIDVTVKRGEIVGVIGANGAGKSSLLRAIAGLVPPTAGHIRFEGMLLDAQPPQDRTRLGMSLVPEGRGLFSRMSVEENLMMGGYVLADRGRVDINIKRCYQLFPGLSERRRQLAGTLSGGQQQMLAVSMGLMSDPRFLMLDEPSLGLAPIVIGDIGRWLKEFKSAGITVLLAEQNANLARTIADRIYVLQTGRTRYHDVPEVLFKKSEVVESFLSI